MIKHIPNLLSCLRIPLAFLLLSYPITAIILACITDILDGFLARRWDVSSKAGAILDPICDKFFALFALSLLLYNGQLNFTETALFLSREAALIVLMGILIIKGTFKTYPIKSFISGKIMTSLQFVAFVILFSNRDLPYSFYLLFGFLGISSFLELLIREFKLIKNR